MKLFVVRHASAGTPLTDRLADRDRALDTKGEAQAAALGPLLMSAGASQLHSSPYLRCRQTLEPLAHLLAQPILTHEELGEGRDFPAALAICEGLGDGAVICSHGDLIPALIEAMLRRGMQISGPTGFRKGSIWVIERSFEGAWMSATWRDRPNVTS